MKDCGEAVLRAALVASLALGSGMALRGLLRSGVRSRLVWLLLLFPLLLPTLLIGYTFSPLALALIRHPWLKEILYDLLLWWRWTPVAALALTFAPTALSEEAWHCSRFVKHRGRGWKFAPTFWLRGPAQAAMVAWVAGFLLTFSEFELASLLNLKTWTVAVFNEHVGGLPLRASLRMTLLPLGIESIFLVFAVMLLATNRGRIMGTLPRRIKPSRAIRGVAWSHLAMATMVGLAIPGRLLQDSLTSVRTFINTRTIAENVGASLLFALAAAAATFLIAGWFAQARSRTVAAMVLSLPSLLGGLVLSLGILFCFQAPLFHHAYRSPLPFLLALTLLLFPYALLLRILLATRQPRAAVHAAVLLKADAAMRKRGRALLWALETRPQFGVAALLFWWAYFDLTVSAILEPVGMTPVAVRLYNFLHYGQAPAFAAMVTVATLAPLLLLALAGGAQGLFSRMSQHE